MQHGNRWLVAGLALASVSLSACARSSSFDNEAASNAGPAKLEPVKGSPYSQIVLTAHAAQRLGVQMAAVREARVGSGAQRKVIPYAAVLYDPSGSAFTFTSPRRLVFVRRPIAVDYVSGNLAVLRAGPPSGTAVVTVGAAELLGTEYGVEEG
jgi:hypothetical protein